MKQKYLFIFLTVLSAVFACEQLDESKLDKDNASVEEAKVEMTFTAVIEKDIDTKTLLVDSDNAGLKKVFWSPDDAIGVSNTTSYTYRDEWNGHWEEYSVSKFVASIDEPAASADFDGSAGFGDTFKAFYPYTETLRDSSGYFVFNLPMVQKYVAGSFDPNAAPMVATAAYGETFEFKNLCGIVAFNLTGTSAVKSIMFSGTDGNGVPVPVSGLFDVNPASSDLAIRQHSTFGYVQTSVTVDCVEPVQLNEAAPTTFYMMLPPATYADFSLVITTADGEIMMKSGKNLTITRSHLKPTGELEYVESEYVDLSAKGTSNSYIVEEAGLYSFKANVIGNGSHGYIQGTNFYPASPDISPKKVKLLWEDKPETVSSLALKDGRVNFMASGIEGNALIAVTDDSENILWSWHIWVTDQPQEQTYVNDKGTFHVLDRNIGATRADRGTGEEWRASRGLLYQWGRKDPFPSQGYVTSLPTRLYLEEAILMPTTFIQDHSKWLVDEDWSGLLWSAESKTIYDPCPAGYRVAVKDIWYGFTKDGKHADRRIKINASGDYDKGWNFFIDKEMTRTAWYPSTNVHYGGWYDSNENAGHMWSSTNISDWNAYSLEYQYTSDMQCAVNNIDKQDSYNVGFAVRCMKDSGYESTKAPEVKYTGVTDVTTTSVTMNGKVTTEGWGSVTDRGFVWGTTSDLSDGQKVSCGAGAGDFSYTLNGLASGSVYYVKAYAVNGYTTSYGEIHRFSTRYSDDAENLSSSGTANSYMVRPVAGTYSFDARAKGNSTESLSPVSASVIWEVDANRNVRDNIVDNARVSDGWILFELPTDVQSGNALIAAKDANGTILWSWHIWVVDYDPLTEYHNYGGVKVMDRLLGASMSEPDYADLENTWELTAGTLYQWGRKDPLIYDLLTNTSVYRFNSVEESIRNPLTFAQGDYYWTEPFDNTMWSSNSKTKYDPCPAGWRVAYADIFNALGHIQTYDPYGVIYNVNGEQVWFGYGDYIHSQGAYYVNNTSSFIWTSDIWDAYNGRSISFYGEYNLNSNHYTDAYAVRCMKDE